MGRKYRRALFEGTLRQDLKYFDEEQNTVGALSSRLESYPESISDLMGVNITLLTGGFFSVISCSILGIAISWKLGLVGVSACVPFIVLAGILGHKVELAMDKKMTERLLRSASIASEAVLAVRTVSSLALERRVLERYTDELDRANREALGPLLVAMIWNALTQGAEYFVLALGFW